MSSANGSAPGQPSGPPADAGPATESVADGGEAEARSSWLSGPHPAALAALEVAEEIEAAPVLATRTDVEGFEDHVRMYLREIGTVPLLTWAGEKRLARAMEAGTYLQEVVGFQAAQAEPASTRAAYVECYRRFRAAYRFALAAFPVEAPGPEAYAGSLQRAAEQAELDPEHVRTVAEQVELAPAMSELAHEIDRIDEWLSADPRRRELREGVATA